MFDYETSIKGKLEGINTEKEKVKIFVALKHLSNFWRTLDMPLINCEINLILTWSEICVLTSKATRDADPDANPAVAAVNSIQDGGGGGRRQKGKKVPPYQFFPCNFYKRRN